MKKRDIAGRILLSLLWIGIIIYVVIHADDFTLDRVIERSPEKMGIAILAMMGLFVLKSVSFIIYSGILYAASGLLFPLPAAVSVNLLGASIMITIPYLLGKHQGGAAVKKIREKYPRAEKIKILREKNDTMFTFLMRIIRIIPGDFIGLYSGAAGVRYPKYLLGSYLAVFPHIFTYAIMGMSVRDIESPEFIISAAIEILYTIMALVVTYRMNRARKSELKT